MWKEMQQWISAGGRSNGLPLLHSEAGERERETGEENEKSMSMFLLANLTLSFHT